jgi:ribosome-associated translation inhibitor RaiA
MLILVHGNGFALESDLREEVQEKIEASFARFSSQIGKVNAYLADLNGPKKGIDKSIRLVIDIEREPVVVIEEKGEDWSSLLESVADRATQNMARRIKRSRSRKDRTSMAGDEDASIVEEMPPVENGWNPLSDRTKLS